MNKVQPQSNNHLVATSVLALLISATVLICAHAIFQLYHDQPSGYTDIPSLLSDLSRPAIMLAGTFLGILFSLLIKQLLLGDDTDEIELKNLISKRRILFSALLSPLVLAAMYAQLVNLTSVWLVFLISYQNGYFWENLLSTMRPARKTLR